LKEIDQNLKEVVGHGELETRNSNYPIKIERNTGKVSRQHDPNGLLKNVQ